MMVESCWWINKKRRTSKSNSQNGHRKQIPNAIGSKRNDFIITPRVIIKAIIIINRSGNDGVSPLNCKF